MTEETTTIIIRIEKSLKEKFDQVAKKKDLSMSQMIRQFIREKTTEETTPIITPEHEPPRKTPAPITRHPNNRKKRRR